MWGSLLQASSNDAPTQPVPDHGTVLIRKPSGATGRQDPLPRENHGRARGARLPDQRRHRQQLAENAEQRGRRPLGQAFLGGAHQKHHGHSEATESGYRGMACTSVVHSHRQIWPTPDDPSQALLSSHRSHQPCPVLMIAKETA